jgi:hypothetical protein
MPMENTVTLYPTVMVSSGLRQFTRSELKICNTNVCNTIILSIPLNVYTKLNDFSQLRIRIYDP